MSEQLQQAAAEISDTSYAWALEDAYQKARTGLTPRDVLDGLSMGKEIEKPKWEDAIFALAYVRRALMKNNAVPQKCGPAFKTPTKRPRAPKIIKRRPKNIPSAPASIIDTAKLEVMRRAGR